MHANTTVAMSVSEEVSDAESRNWLANQPYVLLPVAAACWAGPPATLAFLRW